MNEDDMDQDEIVRTARTRRDKVIRFAGEGVDGEPVTWYVAYRGKYGWVGCRANGSYTSEPDEEVVLESFDVYDEAELLDRSDTPDEVIL